MTEQPDLPPELLAQVIDVKAQRLAFESWWKTWVPASPCPSAQSHTFDAWLASARAVAPMLIAHGRELAEAEIVKFLRTEAASNFRAAQSSWKDAKETGSAADLSIGDGCFHTNQILARAADQIDTKEHGSKP